MTKTSTPTHLVNFPKTTADEKIADEAEQQDELFYTSIKSKLNELVKDPTDETINKILAYNQKK